MTIKDWPKSERPRERLLYKGAAQLTDAELLALFIRSGTKQQSAMALARTALKQSGSLSALFAKRASKLAELPGFGLVTYCQLQAALELSHRRYQEILTVENILQNPAATKRFVQDKLQSQDREVFACLLLDIKCRLLHYQALFYGTINRSHIYLREILKLALQHNASGIIIAHNHPSGDPSPSEEDKAVTLQLQQALGYLDIQLWDHLIVGGNKIYSLQEMGIL